MISTLLPSMTLLVIGMIVLGKKFAAKTAYCSILLSVTLSFLERVCPMKAPLTDQPMLELCFAIALPALGSAILFNIGSSSGGTDIIAMILKKYSSFNIGLALMLSDLLSLLPDSLSSISKLDYILCSDLRFVLSW